MSTVPDFQPILSIRGTLPAEEVPTFTHRSLERIRLHMKRRGIERAGSPFVATHPSATPGRVEVEVGWPTRRPGTGSGDIHPGILSTRRPRLHEPL
jgi:hypothetical protein